MLDSQWWSKQKAEQEQFRAVTGSNLARELGDVDALLSNLALARDRRVRLIVDEGTAQQERRRHAEELQRLEARKAEETRLFKLEQEKQQRQSELRQAQARAEQERKARLAKAEEAEQAKLALDKKQAEEAARQAEKARVEREAKARKDREAQERADAERKAREAKEREAKEREAKERAAKERETKEREAKARDAPTAPEAQAKPAPPVQDGHAPEHIQAEFKANQDRIEWIKANVKQAMAAQPSEVRQKTMDIKLELRPKFGMLTNTKAQLLACRSAVKQLFQSVQQSGNALVFQWTLNIYAKLLVEQAEAEANVQLQNALPLAMLTILLWEDFPELGSFVVPRLVKRCPQLIGYYCPIDTVAGRARMGWKRELDETYESTEQYMGRLSGICAVWACMTQTKLGTNKPGPHPYNLGHSWTFVSRLLNKPEPLVTSTDYALAAAWWDMTALRLYEAFGRQAHKLLTLLWDDYTRGKQDPPAMRLRGLGENWQMTGKIDHAWKVLT